MKSILKIAARLMIGALIGLIIVIPAIAIIDGESMLTVAKTIFVSNGLKLVYMLVAAVLASLAAFIVQLIVHEGGHLVAGLLTGYKFVSFRFLNFTLIRKDGRMQWRKYDLAGTGGQCLLTPPDKPIDEIDTRWYNAGGVLANLLLSLLGIILLITVDMPGWLNIFWGVTAFIGIFFAITNGIPMKLGGVANDGHNLFQMEKDPTGKRYFLNILKSNALNQEGVQPKDMPADLFELPEQPCDWKDQLFVGNVLLSASRMMNLHQWEEAYELLREAYTHKKDIMPLYLNELNAMMVVSCIATGRDDEARSHYTPKTREYVSQHAPTQSDKRLVAMAVALVLDNDRTAAEEMYNELQANKDRFIHQGDVAMSLDLMRWMLDSRLEIRG